MLLRFFLLSIICWTSCVYAQGTLDKDNRPKLSDEEVDQRLGKGWKGIIYICNPYCEFAAIREDGSWNPPLDKIPTDWAHTKLVAQTDPLYPLLVARSPVLPFTTKKLPHVSSEEESGKVTPPKYAIYNFNWGYSIAGGFLYSQSNWTGNTELQTDLSSKGIQYMPFFQMQLFKGTPSKLWNFWIQHEFDGYYGLSPGYKAQDSNITASSTQYSLSYQAWLTFPKFKIGPRMTYDTESWSVSADSLQHFSFNRQSYLLGIYAQWHHWMLGFDTSFMSKISESQQFRRDPFTLNWYRLKLQKCTQDMTLFDITFGVCGGGLALLDQQKAALSDNILLTQESSMNRTDYGLYFMIRIGEDLY